MESRASSQLRAALRQSTRSNWLRTIDHALESCGETPWRRTRLLETAVTWLGRHGSSSHVFEALSRARDVRSRQRVYNAAASAFAQDRTRPARIERVQRVVHSMHEEGVRPSSWTLQHLFSAARGDAMEPEALLRVLVSQMQLGVRPSRAACDCTPARW